MKTEELDVFRLSHQLALEVYRITKSFPEIERFGLISQIRRSSTSIPTNLMEGSHRMNRNEFRHFISIARGSCGEIKYQLLLSKDVGYIQEEKYTQLNTEYERVSMMLTKLYSALK